MPVPAPAGALWYAASTTFHAPASGTYYVICPVPGHAQKEMWARSPYAEIASRLQAEIARARAGGKMAPMFNRLPTPDDPRLGAPRRIGATDRVP